MRIKSSRWVPPVGALLFASGLTAACGRGELDGSGRESARLSSAIAPRLGTWSEVAPLPMPVANNAVAGVTIGDRDFIFSFFGLDSTRLYSGIHARAFRYEAALDRWSEVAGREIGRLAATAQAVAGKIYLFSGYTVAADGSEKSLSDVAIYDPVDGSWSLGAPIPVPVDDAVSGVWRDSLIYLISGWHDRDNVPDVQLYDPLADSWRAATPIPGPPVFGQAGGIVGNTIVYADGVRRAPTGRRFQITDAAYLGEIDPDDPTTITWHKLPPHPGPPLYRMAAGAVGTRVIFAGGTANPYNYDGIGYDGEPSAPTDAVFAFNVARGEWETLSRKTIASMDHRGFAVLGDRLYIVGGMTEGQHVTPRVQTFELDAE